MSTMLVDQPSRRPTRKLMATGAGGSGVIVVTWVAEHLGLHLDAQAAGFLALAGGLVVGYLKRDQRPPGDTPGTNGRPDHAA